MNSREIENVNSSVYYSSDKKLYARFEVSQLRTSTRSYGVTFHKTVIFMNV
jgi:hypothetical protein